MGGKFEFHRSGHEVKPWHVIDHSDVYLENQRLAQDLVIYLETIRHWQYRQFMWRESDIAKLKHDFTSVGRRPSSGQDYSNNHRPDSHKSVSNKFSSLVSARCRSVSQTVGSSLPHGLHKGHESHKRNSLPRNKVPTTKMAAAPTNFCSTDSDGTAEDTLEQNKERLSNSESETHGRKTSVSKQAESNGSPDEDDEPAEDDVDAVTPNLNEESGVPTKRATKKQQTFPSEWYSTVVPASDVHMKLWVHGRAAASSDPSRSSKTLTSPGRNMARNNPPGTRGTRKYGRSNRSGAPPPPSPDTSTLICHEPPTSRARRQLIEMSPGNDKKQKRSYLVLQQRRQDSLEQMKRVEDKVKDFLRSLEEEKKAKKKITTY